MSAPEREAPPGRPRLRRGLWALVLLSLFILLPEPLYRGYRQLEHRRQAGDRERFDLYTLGGSAAAGWPWFALVPQDAASAFLGGQVGGRPIVTRPLAQEGESIYPQRVRFERQVRYRDPDVPGAVIVFSGNNDFIDPRREPRPLPEGLRLERSLAERSLLFSDLSLATRRRVPGGRPDYSLEHYEYNLRKIVLAAKAAGLAPILATVATNRSACEPGLGDLPERDTGELAGLLERARSLEATGDLAGSLAIYQAALGRWPDADASLHYWSAGLQRRQGDLEGARESYGEALDWNPVANTHRATRLQNDIVRRLAREYELELIDAVAAFEAASPEGLVGAEFFVDGVHLSPAGVRLLGEQYAKGISRRFGEPLRGALTEAEFTLRETTGSTLGRGYKSGAAWFFSLASPGTIFEKPQTHALRRELVARDWPADVFGVIRRNFEIARAETPDDFSAHLGLALLTLGEAEGYLLEAANYERLVSWKVFDGLDLWVPDEELPDLLARLERAGAPPEQLADLRRVHALGPPPPAP